MQKKWWLIGFIVIVGALTLGTFTTAIISGRAPHLPLSIAPQGVSTSIAASGTRNASSGSAVSEPNIPTFDVIGGDSEPPELPVTRASLSSEEFPQRVVVYAFLSPTCPVSNSCIPELKALATKYEAKRFEFLGVIPGTCATSDEVDTFRSEYQIPFPIIIDHTGVMVDLVGATHTPQVVVHVDSTVMYSGRINSRFIEPGKARNVSIGHDLAEALDQLSAGKLIECRTTEPVGCLIEPERANTNAELSDRHAESHTEAGDTFTFNRDVAPILFRHCSRCHRDGEAAPFSLMSYSDVRSHASQMDIMIQRRLMPPWKAAPEFAEFANEHRLTDAELATWTRWFQSEQREGDPEDLPLTPIFSDGWQLGRPDLELIMPEAFHVPADGPDIYQHFVIPTGLTENRLVNAVEFRPGAPEVVHHSITYFDTTGRGRELDAEDPQLGYQRLGSPGFAVSGSLGGWGPGGQPRRLPPGMGRLLEKGSDLIVQVHYHPIGRPVEDQSRVGLYFAPPEATHLVTEVMAANVELEIPAGSDRHRHHAEYQLPTDTLLFDATPHMHVLGREIKAVARKPDGHVVPLVWIRNWDFYWQDSYVFVQPVRLPAGTRLELDCWFDNSADNPLNPNQPPQTVRWGDFSTDEMGICYFQATTDTWDDYQTLNRHATQYFKDLWDKYQQTQATTSSSQSAP